MGITFCKYDNLSGANDKQILCELVKDVNGYINKKWTGTPMTVQEIEQVFGLHNINDIFHG